MQIDVADAAWPEQGDEVADELFILEHPNNQRSEVSILGGNIRDHSQAAFTSLILSHSHLEPPVRPWLHKRDDYLSNPQLSTAIISELT